LNKIHFFPYEDSLGISLPNHDGTISLIIEAPIHTYKKKTVCPFTGRTPFTFDRVVFTDREDAKKYLQGQNPNLARVLSDSVDQIVNKRPERFIQAFVSKWRVQKLGVLLGDAGSCAPPWAGFGMNLACSHAEDLARLVCQSNDLDSALDTYEHRRIECTKVVQKIIKDHGDLLGGGMWRKKWRRDQTLRDRREQLFGERSEYQIVAFEERGLETLAELE
jgi:2-polyprenyl-6-methoxyphenol hydroxylase-like FAD-dependent oxidoreductase